MCIAAPALLSTLATKAAATPAAGWLASKTGITAAARAAAHKALMAKITTGATVASAGAGVKTSVDAKRAASKALMTSERTTASQMDSAAKGGSKIKQSKRRKPGRSSMYI